jgi:hypothetical protein
MAEGVNSQITDAITQTNVKVLGESPAQALSMVYQTLAHSLSLCMQNAGASQQQMQSINTAIVATSSTNILGLSSSGAKVTT